MVNHYVTFDGKTSFDGRNETSTLSPVLRARTNYYGDVLNYCGDVLYCYGDVLYDYGDVLYGTQ